MTINDINKGSFIVVDGEPYEVLELHVFRMQQRKPVAQTKIRNLASGKVISRTFHQNESVEETEIDKIKVKFLYSHRDEYWFTPYRACSGAGFSEGNDSSRRFKLSKEIIGDQVLFLKSNTIIDALKFEDKIINIKLPIKIDFKVLEAPPSIRGDTAQGGTKTIIIEGGAKISAPLFIEGGDIIRVNTETGAYVERIEKGR